MIKKYREHLQKVRQIVQTADKLSRRYNTIIKAHQQNQKISVSTIDGLIKDMRKNQQSQRTVDEQTKLISLRSIVNKENKAAEKAAREAAIAAQKEAEEEAARKAAEESASKEASKSASKAAEASSKAAAESSSKEPKKAQLPHLQRKKKVLAMIVVILMGLTLLHTMVIIHQIVIPTLLITIIRAADLQ